MKMLRASTGEIDDVRPVKLRRDARVLRVGALNYIHAVSISPQSAEVPDAIGRRQLRVFVSRRRWYDSHPGRVLARQLQDVSVHPRCGWPELFAAHQQNPLFQIRLP